MPVYEKTFRTGHLHLSIPVTPVPLHDVFDIAERENPKRAFMFMSKLLGHHLPVAPDITRQTFRRLAAGIPSGLEEPVLFLGFAENAVALACGVYQEARRRYPDSVLLLSTRHPVEGNAEILCEFTEAHSHATDHLVYVPADPALQDRMRQAKTLVLIDDESTTGNTMYSAIQALEKHRPPFRQVVGVNIMDWSDNALAGRLNCPVTPVAILSGQCHWTPAPDAPSVSLPPVNVSTPGRASLSARQDWGRLGMQNADCHIGQHVQAQPGERILVLGTAEFVWPPFLLAERLQQEGAEVLFAATTRSPLLPGHAITSVLTFPDNYGQNIPHFLYNTQSPRYDRIILCAETPLASLPDSLLRHLAERCDALECLTYR